MVDKLLEELYEMETSPFTTSCITELKKLYMYEQLGTVREIKEALAEAEAIKKFGRALPCKLGDPVFRIMTYCTSKDFFSCKKEEGCNKCLDAEYKLESCEFQYNMLDTWNEEFFATKESGEKKIKELICSKCNFFEPYAEFAFDKCSFGCCKDDREEDKACYKKIKN